MWSNKHVKEGSYCVDEEAASVEPRGQGPTPVPEMVLSVSQPSVRSTTPKFTFC